MPVKTTVRISTVTLRVAISSGPLRPRPADGTDNMIIGLTEIIIDHETNVIVHIHRSIEQSSQHIRFGVPYL